MGFTMAAIDQRASTQRDECISVEGIGKVYGPTVANAGVSLKIDYGEILGLIGANGAGKSTLVKILCGIVPPDKGIMRIGGQEIDVRHYTPREARRRGIRLVHQELSLSSNLTVTENYFLEDARYSAGGWRWRERYARLARRSIEEVFPGSQVDVHAPVRTLRLGEQQMVEIAKAVSDPRTRTLILDEPTSALDTERARQLHTYLVAKAREGMAFIYITHKLAEILNHASRTVVMRGGRIVWQGDTGQANYETLVRNMGGGDKGRNGSSERRATAAQDKRSENKEAHRAATVLRISAPWFADDDAALEIKRGEVVGLAGLEGSGQREFLHALHQAMTSGQAKGVSVSGRPVTAYISGDRRAEGVFPLWDVFQNMAIAAQARRLFFKGLQERRDKNDALQWMDRIKLDRARLGSNILELSGGNQQKAIVARAMSSDSEVILLDDPTRGVDVTAKNDFYQLVDDLAKQGKTIIWYSTEDLEFLRCDRLLIFQDKVIRTVVPKEQITRESIVDYSFMGQPSESIRSDAHKPKQWGLKERLQSSAPALTPFVAALAIFAIIGWMNPRAVSSFGLDLLLAPAIPLVLLAASQMFIVGGSQIDLGIGPFAGLVNVISATALVSRPWAGAGGLLLCVLAYGCMAGLIVGRKLPAIVVTLGASFIWFGMGYGLQPTPGGSSPPWLAAALNWSLWAVPSPVLIILLIGVFAFFLNRSRLGVVLRGFGGNAQALVSLGWSAFLATWWRYILAGLFGVLGGLAMTAVNTASDINASASFTLLSIAAIVIGGCKLVGGVISPWGITFGAVTLTLIGSLLGFAGVSTDYVASVQGALLISILGAATLLARGSHEDE